MIKINKDITQIPVSLIPAFADLFPEREGRRIVRIPTTAKTTHERRMEVIILGTYINHVKYNNRYKLDDIKDSLNSIYKGKCAFCEQKAELSHVEHYRPKDIYYWLAFSWDNLLLSCPTCNFHKGNNFDLDGVQATFENNATNLKNINSCSESYDLLEAPKMVNPEITEPLGQISFEKDGNIKSENARFTYTIEKCKIDRKSLNDCRRSLLDHFKNHVIAVFISTDSVHDQLVGIKTIVRNFIIDSLNKEEEFLAFRKYTIDNNWLNEIVNECN